jgi:hypothetical protein
MFGPVWVRALACVLAAGAVLGALTINPEGTDLTVVSPVTLSMWRFLAIPAVSARLTCLRRGVAKAHAAHWYSF